MKTQVKSNQILNIFERMTNIYVKTGLDKAELDEISSVAKYNTDKLGNLRTALTEAIGFESKIVVDPVNDPDVE